MDPDASSDGMAVAASSSGREAVPDEAFICEEPSTSTGRSGDKAEKQHAATRVLLSSEILSRWNYARVMRDLGSREQCVAFAEEHSLVAPEKMCKTHKVPMKLTLSTDYNLGSWVCHKGQCKTKSRTARAKGTFFENIKIDLRIVFYLIYAYAQNWSYDRTIHECPLRDELNICLSRATVANWFSYCREVIVLYFIQQQQDMSKIGGVGKIVQIDESKFGKGRHIEGHSVLRMIEDGSEHFRLEVCSENVRSAEVLVPLIKKHVEVGTTIHTDEAYNCLSEHGYIHEKVNHSDPNNPSDVYVEYLWRRKVYKDRKDSFLDLIQRIKFVYKIN